MLMPSLTMWCTDSSSTCSSASSRSSVARKSGPAERWNARRASSPARRTTAASPSPDRSSTDRVNPAKGAITCTGESSTSAKTVRSASWRRTISLRLRSSAAWSSAPARRQATEML
jgi:hypothetical protein